MKRIPHDPRFDYVDMHHTDVAKTFARVRARQAKEKKEREEREAEASAKVRTLKSGKA
uniref:Uncharacterized protein n=1 Tax=viral metagenome TaxID=1070528 RepID=A0A6M3KG75_9ZZZZ